MKMANIDAVFDWMFSDPKKSDGVTSLIEEGEPLYFADVAAGPGGFTEVMTNLMALVTPKNELRTMDPHFPK